MKKAVEGARYDVRYDVLDSIPAQVNTPAKSPSWRAFVLYRVFVFLLSL